MRRDVQPFYVQSGQPCAASGSPAAVGQRSLPHGAGAQRVIDLTESGGSMITRCNSAVRQRALRGRGGCPCEAPGCT